MCAGSAVHTLCNAVLRFPRRGLGVPIQRGCALGISRSNIFCFFSTLLAAARRIAHDDGLDQAGRQMHCPVAFCLLSPGQPVTLRGRIEVAAELEVSLGQVLSAANAKGPLY